MKENKILKENNLEDLIKKFSKSDIVSSIRENYSKENIKYISNYLISDNKYLEKAKVFDSNLKNIKSSIEENGVYKPFYVNYKDNKYEVIIGRKRLRASKELKEENVPCIVFSVNEHEELLMLLADIQDHKEVNMYELSLILNELYSKYNYKLKQLAILINQSIYQVSNILNLVKLPYEILLDLGNNLTSYGICKTLIYAKPNKVMEYYKIYKEKNLSVRDLELLIKNDNKKDKKLNILVDEDNLTVNLKFENSEDLHRFLKKINK